MATVDITSSPQGDGNAYLGLKLNCSLALTLHLPRKGMETFIAFLSVMKGTLFSVDITSSPQGDGNSAIAS